MQAMLQGASEEEEGMKHDFWLALAIFIYLTAAVLLFSFIAMLLVEEAL
jgi:hypothetical protein